MKSKQLPLVSNELSVIAEGVELNGEFKFSGQTQIYGKIKGSVEGLTNSEIVLLSSSLLDGDITGESIIIAGCVKGSIKASKKLKIKPSARVFGKIEATNLEIEYGSLVEAEIHMPETQHQQSV